MKALWSIGIGTLALALQSCALLGGRVELSSSPSMPAAEGHARFRVTKNGNTGIMLHVKHLAHPDKLTPAASSYVVWIKASKDAAAQNIGALEVGKDLSGALLTETPLHSFELSVTAEASGQSQQPAGQPLLWASYSR